MYLRKQCILDNFLSLTHQMRRGSGRVFHIHSVECLWVRFPSLPPYGLTTVLTFASSTPLTTWHLNISGCETNNYPPTLLVLEGYTKRSYIHIWHHSVRHSNTNRVGGWSELGAEYIPIDWNHTLWVQFPFTPRSRGSGRVFHIHAVECLWVRFPSLPPCGAYLQDGPRDR